VGSEFDSSVSGCLMRKDVRPVLKQPRNKLRRELWSICEVADAHDLSCRLTVELSGARAGDNEWHFIPHASAPTKC